MSHPLDDRGGDLRALFFESAYELLQTLNDAGLELEAHSADPEVIRRVRRVVHTLKGDSAACGYLGLSDLAHELENVLLPEIGESRGPQLAEVVLAAADGIDSLLSAYRQNAEPPSTEPLRDQIRLFLKTATDTPASAPVENRPAARFVWSEYEQLMISEALHRGENVYNLALRIDPLSAMRAAAFQLVRNVLHGLGTVIALHPEDNSTAATVEVIEAALACTQTEETIARRCKIPAIIADLVITRATPAETPEHDLLSELLEAQATVAGGAAAPAEGASPQRPGGSASAVNAVVESTLRVETARIDSVMNLVGELIIGKSMLNRAIVEFDRRHAHDPLHAKLLDALAFQARVLDELHKSVLKIRMVPVEQLFRRFPRVVRDVAKQCNKDVALELAGQNTDLDKGILDALAEPITHLVRNAVDHGIEPPEARLAAGKPARGTVYLNAYHQGAQVVTEVRDDGRGIDVARLRAKAVARGLLSAKDAERLSDADALNLIFEPGLSTAAEVTEISGRGVGMDIVRSVLDRLKGTVQLSSQLGQGTLFQLRVPLTLASIQALMFRVNNRLFAVPLSSVMEITRVSEAEIHRVDQREVLQLRDHILSLVRLSSLERIHTVEARKRSFVVVIGTGERRFGLLVDSLVGEEELVIKALPEEIVTSDLVSGASILGDGTVVLILNVSAVLARLSRAPALGAIA
ncbi:MAG: chemotaxis protein CheA [Acidobacteriia bacterium]|nr:chemotaxis protein CheA [Terriglobia bacterium]